MMDAVRTLEKADAWGALEDPTLHGIGYQWLQEFTENGKLKRVEILDELPWLLSIRKHTKRWFECLDWEPWRIHLDHTRCFIDPRTNQRIMTSHPYIELRMGSVDRRFVDAWRNNSETPLRLLEKPNLNSEEQIWRQMVVDEIDKLRQESEKFANKYGLSFEIGTKSWYYPYRSVLVTYKKLAA